MTGNRWMNLLTYALMLTFSSGCSDPLDPALDGTMLTGDLIVSNVTVGSPPYSSAYEIVVGNTPARSLALAPNDSVRVTHVNTGRVSVSIRGIREGCVSTTGVAADVVVAPGVNRYAFTIQCPVTLPAMSILYVSGTSLYRMDLPNRSISRIGPSNGAEVLYPAASPDGRRIAFSGADGLYVMNADGTQARQVVAWDLSQTLWAYSNSRSRPAWSPDGARIVFGNPGTGGLSVIRTDGTGLINVTEPRRADWICSNCPEYSDAQPSWSADGRTIIFNRDEDLEFSTIWSMNQDGSSPYRFARMGGSATYASWSGVWAPDGKTVAFTGVERLSPPGPTIGSGLFITTPEGGYTRRVDLVTGSFMKTVGGWSPDLDWIVVEIQQEVRGTAVNDIFILHIPTGARVRLTTDGTAREPSVIGR